MKELTLVIPAKFESESLPIFYEEIKNLNCKKIVVLEETDIKTLDVIKDYNDLEIVFQKNKGYGSALIEGIQSTKTEFFCIINADGSMDPKYLDDMLSKVKIQNLDFLFASRYEKFGGSGDDSLITKLGNFIFTKIGNIFFDLKITDILFTYVMGKTQNFNNLDLKSQDFTLCVEFPIKSNRKKYKIETLPSFERKRIGGKKKVNEFKDGFLILIKMIKMYFRND
tara:strand:+ start:268 stop:942 length:675 start_codon:yes stop_codon:yes gene_type:complete